MTRFRTVFHLSSARSPRFLILCGLAALLSGCGPPAKAPRKAPRNVLLFLFDAAAVDHFTPYGYPRETTPNLQRLAARGHVFRSHFAVAPYTLSSVASLLTSKYPPFHKVIRAADRLSAAETTLAEVLRAKGLKTGAFVFNPFLDPGYGFSRGFDVYVNYQSAAPPGEDVIADYRPMFRDLRAFLLDRPDRPFFLLLHLLLPHNPYAPPEPYRGLFVNPEYTGHFTGSTRELLEADVGSLSLSRADRERLIDLYDGNLRYGDEILGRVRNALQSSGRLETTDFVVTADHGEAFGEHGRFLHNTTVYDEMIHVPLVVVPSFPRSVEPDTSALSDTVDIFPTILDLLAFPPPARLQGRSVLQPSGASSKPFVLSYSMELEFTALRSPRFKYIRSSQRKSEYYSLIPDPGELRNVIGEDPKRFEKENQLRNREEELAALSGPASAPPPRDLDPEQVRRLRSLGYLGGNTNEARATRPPAETPRP